MGVRRHRSVDDFRATAGPFYARDPVTHTVELTLLQTGRIPDDSVMLTIWDGAELLGTALQTPPFHLISTAIPVAAMSAVVDEVVRMRPDLGGVRGPREHTAAFADAWRAATGSDPRRPARTRLRIGRHGHRGGRRPRGSHPDRPLHRRRQPGVQRDLPPHRVRAAIRRRAREIR